MQKESKKISLIKLFLSVVLGLIIAVGGYGCETNQDEAATDNDSAAESVVHEETEPVEYEEAENSFCYVCHLNFQDEPFATKHQKVNVGCVDCHGDSDQHSADEAHIIPPDTMYKKSEINESCLAVCHSKEELEEFKTHRKLFAGKDPKNKYCTDCHGKHSIPERHRVWDKDTKKLIEADGQPYEGDINPGGGAEVHDSGMGM